MKPAEKVVKVLKNCVENICKITMYVEPTSDGMDVTLHIYSDTATFDAECSKLKRTCKRTKSSNGFLCTTFSIEEAQKFAEETKSLFEFLTEYFHSFTTFWRYPEKFDEENNQFFQGTGFALEYKKEIFSDYYFPSKISPYPEDEVSEAAENMITILKSRLKMIDFIEVVLFESGTMRLICKLKGKLPKRLKKREGVKVKLVPNGNYMLLDLKFNRVCEFSKVMWYLHSRCFAILTVMADVEFDEETRRFLTFQCVRMTDGTD